MKKYAFVKIDSNTKRFSLESLKKTRFIALPENKVFSESLMTETIQDKNIIEILKEFVRVIMKRNPDMGLFLYQLLNNACTLDDLERTYHQILGFYYELMGVATNINSHIKFINLSDCWNEKPEFLMATLANRISSEYLNIALNNVPRKDYLSIEEAIELEEQFYLENYLKGMGLTFPIENGMYELSVKNFDRLIKRRLIPKEHLCADCENLSGVSCLKVAVSFLRIDKYDFITDGYQETTGGKKLLINKFVVNGCGNFRPNDQWWIDKK